MEGSSTKGYRSINGGLLCVVLLLPFLYFGQVSDAEAQLLGALNISGRVSASIQGRIGSFNVAQISNHGDPDTVSGTIKVTLWATRRRYTSGTIAGTRVLECTYDGLQGGFFYSDLACRVRVRRPRAGRYYMTLTAAEFDGDSGQYFTEDFVNFPKTIRF